MGKVRLHFALLSRVLLILSFALCPPAQSREATTKVDYRKNAQLLLTEILAIKKSGVKSLDSILYSEKSADFPLLIGVYHHLMKEQTQQVISDATIISKGQGAIELAHKGKTVVRISQVDFASATFLLNGKVFSFHGIQTFEDLKERIKKDFTKQDHHAIYNWLFPRANALADGGVISIPVAVGIVVSLVSLAIAAYSLHLTRSELAAKAHGTKECVEKITDLIRRAHIAVIETRRICADAPEKVQPQVVPEVTKQIIIRTDDTATTNTTITPEDISRIYVNAFNLSNFAIDPNYCNTIISSLKVDLLIKDANENTRAGSLQKHIAMLPGTREVKLEDKQCIEAGLRRLDPSQLTPEAK